MRYLLAACTQVHHRPLSPLLYNLQVGGLASCHKRKDYDVTVLGKLLQYTHGLNLGKRGSS